jgi:phosphoenolpyruvate carboxykinase (GTP)
MPEKLHPKVKAFIDQAVELTKAKKVVLIKNDQIKDDLIQTLIKQKTLIPLKREGSFLARSDPKDTARVEEKTFICCRKESDGGPTNHYEAPAKMRKKLDKLFDGSMEGKVAYVVFFAMGSLESPLCKLGIEITDSAYVALNLLLMTRVDDSAFSKINETGEFIACLHSTSSKGDMPSWPCDPENTVIAHFPETQEIYSYGSGYGGNALLGKKCIALRLCSALDKKTNHLAEHMLIIKVTSPEGISKGFMAAFPSSCGKTNLALMQSKLPGWKVECVGDDIAWIEVRPDGFYAINPEMGFFGIASGTSWQTNPVAMETIQKNTIFTNVALTKEGDVWWEKLTDQPPEGLIDWKGKPYKNEKGALAAHPNSRFTVSILQCPTLAKEFNEPKGLKIDAILFGGRRKDTIPLVMEASSYQMGVLFGSMLSSETTAAAKGEVGKIRHDPFAMLPFCGYHMGDYFKHWLEVKKSSTRASLPHFFVVNWFLKDEQEQYIWPGFQENIRVIEWIFRRMENKVKVEHTVVGNVPTIEEFNFEGLKISEENKKQLFLVDQKLWKKELLAQKKYLSQFDPKLPDMLLLLIDKLLEMLPD